MALGLSQERLAHESGINRTYIGSLESGRRNPSFDNLCRLAIALGVDVGELISGLHILEGRALF